jgi:hypothetical protein
MRELQLYCRPSDVNCVDLLEQEISKRYIGRNLVRYDEAANSQRIGMVPSDKLDAVLGLIFSLVCLAVGLVLLVLLAQKCSELVLLMIICSGVVVWAVFRMGFW